MEQWAKEHIANYQIITIPEALTYKETSNFMIGFLIKDDNLIIHNLSDIGLSFEHIENTIKVLIKIKICSLYIYKYELILNLSHKNINLITELLEFIKNSEKDIFSLRSKQGLKEAQLKGIKIGRPKSDKPPKNRLDKHKKSISNMLKAGYKMDHIASKYNINYRQLLYYIKTRNL